MSNYPDNVSPNDLEAPWNKVGPGTKRVRVFVRFAGVKEIDIEVPADLDLRDSDEITNALDKYTAEHRPDYAEHLSPEDWAFTNLKVGEFWYYSDPSATGWGFKEPTHYDDAARIYIESVEEL